jgi:glycosidase
MMEFHISRQARDHYQFDHSLFALNGNVLLANFHASRMFAQKMNQKRDLVNFPEKAVKAGQINAMGLIDEILHYVILLYREQKNPKAILSALDWLDKRVGVQQINRALLEFTRQFPPLTVYRRELTANEYLDVKTGDTPNRAIALEEMIILWVSNKNPALTPFLELFDDDTLNLETAYPRMIKELQEFFATQPPFGPDQQPIIDMLRAPAIAVPYSLTGQLDYIRSRWGDLIGSYLFRLLSSMDFIKEEEKMSFMGPGPVPIPIYSRDGAGSAGEEAERFSPDQDWMPRLVLIAKNSYVWLDQLTKKYQRPITRLDLIPDEELDQLARWGFSGLWLIGLWERSKASAYIKQLCGNPEAIASAYSLFNYDIAWDLGGEEAYANLRDRAWQRGIRLASDMVPNHMGIDSPWLVEHPDWFVSLDYSPFPAYRFNGPNLSNDGRASIYLEDHYFDRSDAAVVFKRVDNDSGRTQYVYHGNDGTSMPWNDTAQLNYLNPAVREAVIQTILNVARRFPIIRFDAAMTLAKKHYQRLWYPEPGTGGAIPSRAEQGLTRDQFDQVMPIEFWRELVDRAAIEAPDTLLLAEAFWLMEGYFVRTLGMHRVYNSAFMNLLRNEDNAKYRLVIKNTLEFDPEILKRYVNFMNNPDERTAVDQFGKGDKYFGICTLMATFPGLPMFGHGQIEGFSEKYGMEFRRAYWEEQIDPYLVERHQREIFPLLHRRSLFAGVDNFLLYDFFTPEAQVNEDVFAFSNGIAGERALVIFHNKFAETRGWVRTSAAYSVKSSDQRTLTQRNIGQGLNLNDASNMYVIFRDQASGLEYILPCRDITQNGFYIELKAYHYAVFMDFRQVRDDAWQSYRHLHEYLAGRGVPDISDAIKELVVQPVLLPFHEIVNSGYFNYLLDQRLTSPQTTVPMRVTDEARRKMSAFMDGVSQLSGQTTGREIVLDEVLAKLALILSIPVLETRSPISAPKDTPLAGAHQGVFQGKTYRQAIEDLRTGLTQFPERWPTLLGWCFVHNIGRITMREGYAEQSLSWIEEWQLGKPLAQVLAEMGQDQAAVRKSLNAIRILISQQDWFEQLRKLDIRAILETWLCDVEIQRFIGVNRHKDNLWFNKESFEEFAWWMMALAVMQTASRPDFTTTVLVERILGAGEIIQQLLRAESESGYQIDGLLEALSAPIRQKDKKGEIAKKK